MSPEYTTPARGQLASKKKQSMKLERPSWNPGVFRRNLIREQSQSEPFRLFAD